MPHAQKWQQRPKPSVSFADDALFCSSDGTMQEVKSSSKTTFIVGSLLLRSTSSIIDVIVVVIL